MQCRQCGAELRPGARFCNRCGAPQFPATAPTQEPTISSTSTGTPAVEAPPAVEPSIAPGSAVPAQSSAPDAIAADAVAADADEATRAKRPPRVPRARDEDEPIPP